MLKRGVIFLFARKNENKNLIGFDLDILKVILGEECQLAAVLTFSTLQCCVR